MQLQTLTSSITSDYKDDNHIEIEGMAYDSRAVKPGYLFICIVGQKVDGHDFLKQAVEKGAVAAIVEREVEGISIPQILVDNTRLAMAPLSAKYYDDPSKEMQVVGITATNGKTTTAYMTDAVLEAGKFQTGLIGTVNIKYGDKDIPSRLTTPESLELQKYFREMSDAKTSHVVMEVSSAAQEMHRTDDVDFSIVSLNNINREHIDTHGTFERYVSVKTRLIKNASPDTTAILNLDCEFSDELIEKTAAKVVTFSVHQDRGDIRVRNLDLSTGRAKFTVEIMRDIETNQATLKQGKIDVKLSIPGLHSVSNSMIALIVGLLNNMPVEVIQKSLYDFVGVDRRFQFIYENGPIIIDDHFANPGNIDVTLETISLMKYNQFHIVYAIRGQRGTVVNEENAESFAEWAKKLDVDEIVATRSIGNVTELDEVTDQELQVFLDVMAREKIKVHLYDSLDEAISHGLNDTKDEDLLLLAGCQGMDDGPEIALDKIKG